MRLMRLHWDCDEVRWLGSWCDDVQIAGRCSGAAWYAEDLSRPFVVRIAYLAALGLVAPLLAWNGFVRQVNAAVGDILLRLRGPEVSRNADGIVLLAIDDRTAATYGPLPLRRSLLAEGLNRLAAFQPKVLALDLLLSEPTEPAEDGPLSAALRRFPACVLSAAMESDGADRLNWLLPLPLLRDGAAVGHVHAAPDADGVVRSVLLQKQAEGRRYWALGLVVARLALGAPTPLEATQYLDLGPVPVPAAEADDRLMAINYAGPEGTFRRVPFAAVLDGSARAEAFRGRIVIVGATAQGSGDRLFTPVSSGLGMSGIEIHANVVRTILDRAFLVPLGAAGELLVYAMVAAACLGGVGWLHGSRLVTALAATAASLPLVCLLALRAHRVWPLASMLAVFLAAAGIAIIGEYGFVSAALRRSEQKRKEYAFRVQVIAHEIKTPLTAIQGSSEMISEHWVPDEKRVEMAGLIHQESRRLTALIQVFLDVERMAAGGLKLEKRTVDARELGADVLDRAHQYAARKRIRIESDIPALMVRADPELLTFAIYNLLTNAVKYSPRGSEILLSAVEGNDSVAITVADQGYGIAASEQQRVFDKFYRLKRDEKGPESGSGIGLALVKEIMEQHSGSVRIESRPGAGSRFTLVLPK